MHLEFFAANEDVEKLEAQLARTPQDVQLLVHLAWAMRQRDCERALLLADQVQVLLGQQQADFSAEEIQSNLLRIDLIRGEVKWLMGELLEAKALAQQVLHGFMGLQEGGAVLGGNALELGCADAYWLLAWVANDQGEMVQHVAALQATANASPDAVRICVAHAAEARIDALRDLDYALQRWDGHFSENLHPAAACSVQVFLALCVGLQGDQVGAIRHYCISHNYAFACGQMRLAIVLAVNIGWQFHSLHDYPSALEWLQPALQLARRCAWPNLIGMVLRNCGNTMRGLRKFALAGDMLREARELMASVVGSRNFTITLLFLAELELDKEDYARALASFQELEIRGRALQHTDLISSALRGQAQALNQLGQALPAQAAALAALEHAEASTDEKIPVLRTLAAIHARHSLPLPSANNGVTASFSRAETSAQQKEPISAALYYLQQALDLAASVEKYNVPAELFEEVATEYARLRQFERAYEFSAKALQSLRAIHNQQAADRAVALQAAHESEQAARALEESQHLAQEEARRAVLLQQANDTLQTLGSIGQQITAHLDKETVFAVLEQHLAGLLAFDSIAIYLLDQECSLLRVEHWIERGKAMPSVEVALSNPQSNSVRCLREEREILLEIDPTQENPNQIPDSIVPLTAFYAPLRANEQAFGVLSIQSTLPHAYGTREQMIFRTLSAYTAIALSNCDAHQQMQESQRQLIQQEKMASLGQLVANVAHEINTPIGVMKASSEVIHLGLRESAIAFPAMMPILSADDYRLFNQMITHSVKRGPPPSAREERALMRACTEQLEMVGIANARHVASVIVQLGAQDHLAAYLPLLRKEGVEQILRSAQIVSNLFASSNTIRQAVGNVSKIVFALKSFTHSSQSDELIPSQLRDGIDTVLTIYHNQIKKGTELIVNDEGLPLVPCLPDELNQVWVNLIHNALQAMQYRGTLTISLGLRGEEALVAVTDTGCGIAPELHKKIFDPFFTTKPSGEGSGLGLDITRKIVAKHKGRIEVESAVGVGSTFSVYLPLSPA